ncbi:MAG: hypothetical protein WCR42_10450 [bacterium]
MDNSTTIIAISALISALATVVLVIVTIWYAYINKKILKSNEKSSEEQLRPYIITHIYSEDYFVFLQIKNIGKRPAKNVHIKFDPPLDEIDRVTRSGNEFVDHTPLLNQAFIPPDFEITTILMETTKFVQNDGLNKIFTVKISYDSIEFNNKLPEKQYQEEYIVNLSNYIYPKKIMKFTNNYYIQKMQESIEVMKNSLMKISNK